MFATHKIYFVLLFCLFAFSSKAQTSLNIYPLNGGIGLKFFSDKKISLEPRVDFQFDFANGENNMFVNSELFTTVNFLREDRFRLYSGLGLGANVYNQTQSNFCGSVPIGATYYLSETKRLALLAEAGTKVTAGSFVKIKSYALVGLQIRLKGVKE